VIYPTSNFSSKLKTLQLQIEGEVIMNQILNFVEDEPVRTGQPRFGLDFWLVELVSIPIIKKFVGELNFSKKFRRSKAKGPLPAVYHEFQIGRTIICSGH
jgi:hypothetical protein